MLLKALENTIVKKKPVQAIDLSSSEKFDFFAGKKFAIEAANTGANGHIKITLKEPVLQEKIWYAFRRHVEIEGLVNVALQGTDSLVRVGANAIVDGAVSKLGIKPAYWGRYFSGVDFRGAGEYFRSIENNTLRQRNIKVLPVGRFTTQVNQNRSIGERDGRDQAEDFIKTFGEEYLLSQGGEFYFFLDVEPTPPLSTEYYLGWAEAVAKISSSVRMLPCVYLSAGDAVTSLALTKAIGRGAECHGLWIARYLQQVPISTFNPSIAKPATPVPVPVLFWQYAGDIGNYDFNLSNPEISSQEILNRLVLPQAV